jgi:TonB family protein
MVFLRLVALSSLAFSSTLSAADVPKEPTGKWIADFAANKCLLSRSYGTDEKPFVLTFEQAPMDDGISIHVFKNGNRQDLRYGQAKVRFGSGPTVDAKFGAYSTANKLRRMDIAILDDSYKQATGNETISISANGEFDESFTLPGFGKALDVLHSCVVDLGEHWGLSAEQQNRIAKPAKPNQPLYSYFSGDDYPSAAIKKDASGRTDVRVSVDETGKPTDCIVLRQSGNESLDKVTCGVLLRRARFQPAVDIDGRPVKSIIVSGVTWLLVDAS